VTATGLAGVVSSKIDFWGGVVSSSCTPLSPKEFQQYPIKAIKDISPNTKPFTVALPSSRDAWGGKTSSFVMIQGSKDPVTGKSEARPYTPTTLGDEKCGSIDFVIKAYPNGKVTGHLWGLKIGDSIEIKGPLAKFKYEPNMKKNIGMVAGGTGITPMLQVIQEILRNPEDNTIVHLIFANNTDQDILCQDMIEALRVKHPKKLLVTYVVGSTTNPQYEKGFPTESLLKTKLPMPSSDTLVFVCGPPGMMNAVSGPKTPDYKQGEVGGFLKSLGYKEDMVFKF